MEQKPSTSVTGESFRPGQRVHSANDPRRIGTVKYVGQVEGYSGTWIGVDWDNHADGKHDGSVNGVRYFLANSERSASFVRPQNLSTGITFLQALHLRYRGQSTQEEEDEMYVLSSTNKRVSVQLVGKEKIEDKLSRFEELTSASLSFLGVSSPGVPGEIGSSVPNLKELDLTGNLISEWKDVSMICEQLPNLVALNLSSNLMMHNICGLAQLQGIRVLVLNSTGISWSEVEVLAHSLPAIEELHLMGNNISKIEASLMDISEMNTLAFLLKVSDLSLSSNIEALDSLRLLNLDNNLISEWSEVVKLSQLKSLEQLYLNNNKLTSIYYPGGDNLHEPLESQDSCQTGNLPFENLRSLLLGSNNIGDLASVDSLNSFPKLIDIRLSDNPMVYSGKIGVPRFILVARLSKVEILNGSEISARERKESEIRYVRLIMSKLQGNQADISELDPRFVELKKFYGIEDERHVAGASGPQKMASGLLSITLKCVGPSIGEKLPLTKKLPATTTIGRLKMLCENFFKLKSLKLNLFLQEEGSPIPTKLDDDMASLLDVGIGNDSTILVDEEN